MYKPLELIHYIYNPTIYDICIMCTGDSCPSQPIDVALVLDTSHSIKDKSLELLKGSVAQIVQNLDVGPGRVRVAAIGFGESSKRYFDFNKYTNKASLLKGIKRIKRVEHYRATRTDLALTTMLDLFENERRGSRPSAQHIGIIFTDGRASKTKFLYERLADFPSSIIRFSVGIGRDIDRDELEQIANNVVRNVFYANDFQALNNLVKRISSRVQCPCDPPCERGQCNLGKKECKCPKGYGGDDCKTLCTTYGDVVLVIDCSNSLNFAEFDQVRQYASKMVDSLAIGRDKTHVGVVKFGLDVEVELSLTATYSKNFIKNKLRNMQRPENYRATNTSHALAKALEEFKAHGRRQDQFDRKIILITDGRSTDTKYLLNTVDQLINAQILRFCIGVGEEIQEGKHHVRAQSELRDIIATKESYAVFLPSFADLDQFAENRIAEIQRCD
jgi:uncharacterized protein YegL